MAWSDLANVTCIGFDKKILPILLRALDNKIVAWGRSSAIAGAFSTEFTWADCVWRVDEMNEYVESFTLIDGDPDSESLTAAVLKGKIESS